MNETLTKENVKTPKIHPTNSLLNKNSKEIKNMKEYITSKEKTHSERLWLKINSSEKEL